MARLCARHLITAGIVAMVAGVGATVAWGSEPGHAQSSGHVRISSAHHRALGGHGGELVDAFAWRGRKSVTHRGHAWTAGSPGK